MPEFLKLFLMIALLGLVLYLIERFIPMDEAIKIVLRVLAVIIAIVLICQAFGLFTKF